MRPVLAHLAAFPVSGEAQFRAVDGAIRRTGPTLVTRDHHVCRRVQERGTGAVLRRCMVPLDCPCARGCVGTASRVPAANLRQFVTRIASEACTRWKDTFLLAVRAGRHILRPRAMQVINCAAWYGQQRRQAVARRDSMAARIMAANARNSLEKQV